jgi:hypothetical protein
MQPFAYFCEPIFWIRTMKKRYILVILALFMVVSCKNKQAFYNRPANLINQTQMAEIIADLHIAEASLIIDPSHSDSVNQYTTDYYYAVFQKHKVSRARYDSSLNYYIRNPEYFERVYEIVNEILSTKKGKKW